MYIVLIMNVFVFMVGDGGIIILFIIVMIMILRVIICEGRVFLFWGRVFIRVVCFMWFAVGVRTEFVFFFLGVSF